MLHIDQWLEAHGRDEVTLAVLRVRSTVIERSHANALYALPSKRLSKTLSFALHTSICSWLLPNETDARKPGAKATQDLLARLCQSGLGGDSGQRAFAHAMNAVIDSYIQSPAVKVDWVGQECVTEKLRTWIREVFIPVAQDGLQCLTGNSSTIFLESEKSKWESVALEKLAKQRIKYIFEYVRAWDQSTGAILDLKVKVSSVFGKSSR